MLFQALCGNGALQSLQHGRVYRAHPPVDVITEPPGTLVDRRIANAVAEYFAPYRSRHAELLARPDDVRDILRKGADKVRPVVRETLDAVRAAVGVAY